MSGSVAAADARPPGAPPSTDIRRYLLWLVLAPLIPTLIIGGYLLSEAYNVARERTEQQLLNTSRALSMVIDRQLGQYEASLRALSTSPHLLNGDFAAFDAQARRAAPPGTWIALARRDGQQLVNTRLPLGAKLPVSGALDDRWPTLAAGGTHVSNLFTGPATKKALLAVNVGVFRGNEPLYELSMAFEPDLLNRILLEQRLPNGWYGVVVDRSDTVVARNRKPERFVGMKATNDLRNDLRLRGEGVRESVSLEGQETILAFTRSAHYGWPAIVGAPRAEIAAQASRSLWSALFLSLALICLGAALAFAFSTKLRRSIRRLATAAQGLASGAPAELPASGISELDAMATSLRSAADELRANRSRLALVEQAGEVGYWEWDRKKGEVWWSDGLYRLLGIDPSEPARVKTFVGMVHPEERGQGLALAAQLKDGEPFINQFRIIRPDGSIRWLASKGQRILKPGIDRLVGINFDITQRKTAEEELKRLNEELEQRVEKAAAERTQALEQLHEAQKLETIGMLTGGVAHDFNNLLTPIVGGLDFLKGRMKDDPKILRVLEGAAAAAERARVLVSRLLSFARRQTLESRPVDVGALVIGLSDLVQRSLGPQIDVVIEAELGVAGAIVDPNQLELAVLNLCVNARDAMPGGGRLVISVAHGEPGPGAPELPQGDFICLSVADSGVGMDSETLKRAIEPFFSTKGVGRGTGLGLSMVHGLAGQSGGALRLSSKPGEGTRCELWLPAADAFAAPLPQDDELPVQAAREATILLVDDESFVRQTTTAMLVELGYKVEIAASAKEALAIVASGKKVDALLTDYLMPGATGADLIRQMREILPGLPALVITGYANAAGDVPADVGRLAKPFLQSDLSRRLNDLLVGTSKVIRFPASKRAVD